MQKQAPILNAKIGMRVVEVRAGWAAGVLRATISRPLADVAKRLAQNAQNQLFRNLRQPRRREGSGGAGFAVGEVWVQSKGYFQATSIRKAGSLGSRAGLEEFVRGKRKEEKGRIKVSWYRRRKARRG